MILKDVLIGRLCFAYTDQELAEKFAVNSDELENLTDLDLFLMYEESIGFGEEL